MDRVHPRIFRDERGPYSDPQHPYLYEEDDVWMATGFINQFYEVPDYWKTYAHEVDGERETWLNSFYKAPLRLPVPAELEYWWSKDWKPECILINKEPEPDPENPSKLLYTEIPVSSIHQLGGLSTMWMMRNMGFDYFGNLLRKKGKM